MKKCKECGRDEWGFLSVLNKDGYCPTCAIVHNEEKIKKLQEQLKEANEVIKYYGMGVVTRTDYWAGQPYMRQEETTSFPEKALDYLEKWGVK